MAPHGLILTITIALGAAFLGGFVAARLRLPPIVGYLAAGIAVSPFTPGLSADPAIANELAEVGVSLLMFGVGVHFSLDDLWAVRWVAIPGAIGQIVIATAVTALVVPLWGWTYAQGIVFGLAIAISSTVVLIRTLTDAGLLESAHGKIAVGWVVVEDLGIVVVLVLLPPLAPVLGGTAGASGDDLVLRFAVTLAKVALFGVLMIAVGTRVIPWLLEQVARTGHRELFTLAVLVVALGVAVVAAFAFEVSLALGAFLAGVAISESDLSHQAAARGAAAARRLRGALLRFGRHALRSDLHRARAAARCGGRRADRDPQVARGVGHRPGSRLPDSDRAHRRRWPRPDRRVLFRPLGGRPRARHPPRGRARPHHRRGHHHDHAELGPLPSIEPLAERLRDVRVVRAFDDRRAGALARLERDRAEKLQRHAVVAGHGRVGSLVTRALQRRNMEVLVVEQDRRVIQDLRDAGTAAMYGDAGHALVLERTHLDRAILLVVALRDPQTSRRVVEYARRTNERIGIVARAHTRDAADYLRKAGANEVVLGEEELAIEMTGYALHRLGVSPQEIALIAKGLRAR